MTRSRLQIGPGGMLYLVVAVLILGAAVYTQANLLFWSFGLMVGGLIASFAMAWSGLRKVTVTRLLPAHGVSGEAMVLRYRLTNRKRLLPVFNLVIRELWGRGRRGWRKAGPLAESPPRLSGQPVGWVLHLGPNQTTQAQAICWPLRRGMLHFERVELSTAFPFGVVRRTVTFALPDKVLVYPHLYRIHRRLLHRLSQMDLGGRKQRQRGGGLEDFFGLRPYRAGDSMKMIDWKHTARTGDLVSREFTQASPPRIMILLDLSPPAGGSEEAGPEPREGLDQGGNGRGRGNGRARRDGRKESKPSLRGGPAGGKRDVGGAVGGDGDDGGSRLEAVERAMSLAASLVCDAYFNGYQVGLAVRGAACTYYPMHHSLPHRTRMLEALATLDADKPAPKSQVLPVAPSVVIHPGGDERAVRDARCILLGAAQLEHYVREVEGGSQVLLSRRESPGSRRQQLADDAAARMQMRPPQEVSP